MSARSLSRPLSALAAAGALTLASAGAAHAVPARPDAGDSIAAPKIAAPPTWPLHPQTLTPPRASSPSADAGFQWDDAGIGAGGALLVVIVGVGGAMAFRRRTVGDPPLPA
jgi:hypothetical protein